MTKGLQAHGGSKSKNALGEIVHYLKDDLRRSRSIKMKKVYICAGWFDTEQANIVTLLEHACADAGLDFFSPRLEVIYKPGMNHQAIVQTNMEAIQDCDFMLVSTAGKDMGTLFECGYAYAEKIPTVYYYPCDGKFNIMLAATARAVLQTEAQLHGYLEYIVKNDLDVDIPFEGEME